MRGSTDRAITPSQIGWALVRKTLPMAYEVKIETVQPEWVAAVRARAAIGGIAQVWKPALDQVWAFVKANGGLSPGHNLFLYHHPDRRSDPMDIDFGVQVSHPFEPEGNVRCIRTPAGEVASTVHVGPYDRMVDAHNAIHAWCSAEQSQDRAGVVGNLRRLDRRPGTAGDDDQISPRLRPPGKSRCPPRLFDRTWHA